LSYQDIQRLKSDTLTFVSIGFPKRARISILGKSFEMLFCSMYSPRVAILAVEQLASRSMMIAETIYLHDCAFIVPPFWGFMFYVN
jgi:hypothetical protein